MSVSPPDPLSRSQITWTNVVGESFSDKLWLYTTLYDAAKTERFRLKADPYVQNGDVSGIKMGTFDALLLTRYFLV